MNDHWKKYLRMACGFALAVMLTFSGNLRAEAGNCSSHITGYTCPGHGHNFEGLSTCSQCSGSGTVTTRVSGWCCSTCGENFTTSKPNASHCSKCFATWNGTIPWYKATVKSTTSGCDRCSGHGRNTRCKNTSCQYHYYGWHNGGSRGGTCYTCSGCVAITGDHESAGNATCTSAASCRYCGISMGSALGHAWGNKYVSGSRWIKKCTRAGCGATTDVGSAQYTVSFHANGGGNLSVASKNVIYGAAYGAMPTATRTGYSLNGWWTQKSGGTQVTASTAMKTEGAHTLYAHWSANTYTVTFHANGGTVGTKTKNVTYDGTYGSLPTATRTGYTFLGWYSSPENAGQKYEENTKVTTSGAHTLYAHWKINRYTITYDANGGASLEKSSEVKDYHSAVDLACTASWRGQAPEDEDYVFIGWNTDPKASMGLESYLLPDRNITLYAIWSIPVSDVKEVYIGVWPSSLPKAGRDTSNGKLYNLGVDSTTSRGYYESLNSIRAADDFGGEAVDAYEYAWDYAGNVSIYGEDSPAIRWYQQTVHHMYYDMALEGWKELAVTGGMALEGTTYTPEYMEPEDGYRRDTVDPPYVVEGDKDSYAYYRPITYTLHYDPNGGTCEVKDKEIVYGSLYGSFPASKRSGYTITGWYTQREKGTQVRSKDVYQVAGDSTIYAQWTANIHQVKYDYAANGGTSAGKVQENIAYGQRVDLGVEAVKEGWQHIGWNTDPDAVKGMNSLVMGDGDVILYAIYQKNATATFIDRNDEGRQTRTVTGTMYNRDIAADILIPEIHPWTGWEALGFSTAEDPDGTIETAGHKELPLKESTVFYGIYQREITLSYDTDGSAEEYEAETGIRKYHAGGQYLDPVFILRKAPDLELHSFQGWQDPQGKEYQAESQVTLERDTLFKARWDSYPEIEAYDRYFTLEQAQRGDITQEVLLEKVKGTDREDGMLVNGRDVTVLDFAPEEFLSFTKDGGVSVTYRAVDSVQNEAKKRVMIHIVDTALKENPKKSYVRFLGDPFYEGTGWNLPKGDGGLEDTSLWREDGDYRTSLEYALSNRKQQEEILQQTWMGQNYEIKKPGSGSWQHQVSVWILENHQLTQVHGS